MDLRGEDLPPLPLVSQSRPDICRLVVVVGGSVVNHLFDLTADSRSILSTGLQRNLIHESKSPLGSGVFHPIGLTVAVIGFCIGFRAIQLASLEAILVVGRLTVLEV